MAFSLFRIYMLKELLNVPAEQIKINKTDAVKLSRIAKYYYLSPVFLSMGGIGLQKQLKIKYGLLTNNFSFQDFIINIFTVPFANELFILAMFLFLFYCLQYDVVSWIKYVAYILFGMLGYIVINVILFCVHDIEICYEKTHTCKKCN